VCDQAFSREIDYGSESLFVRLVCHFAMDYYRNIGKFTDACLNGAITCLNRHTWPSKATATAQIAGPHPQ